MSRRNLRQPKWGAFWRVFGVFIGVGLLLFFHVWWPIQAERSALELKRVEMAIFQKKSELNVLNERYAVLAALPVLDQWAKKHGSWVPASAENVILIS